MPITDKIWNGTRFDTIDADTLDKKDASAFALSTHAHTIANVTGLQGALNEKLPTTASCNKNWIWYGQSGQPTWLWGGIDGTNMYVYNPSNFNVNSAITATSATTATTAITAKNLMMDPANYGQPIEIGQYIDFHKVKSTTDYDGRLYIDSSAKLIYTGEFQATKIYNAVWNDYAEYFLRSPNETYEYGDVIISNGDGTYSKSTHKNDQRVVGVYSDSFGQCLGGKGDGNDEKDYLSIGLAGRVKVNLIGNISNGDLVTTSDIPGVAIKVDTYVPGTVIGKAVANKTSEAIEKIEILIMNI